MEMGKGDPFELKLINYSWTQKKNGQGFRHLSMFSSDKHQLSAWRDTLYSPLNPFDLDYSWAQLHLDYCQYLNIVLSIEICNISQEELTEVNKIA